jgi:hypothetical protein
VRPILEWGNRNSWNSPLHLNTFLFRMEKETFGEKRAIRLSLQLLQFSWSAQQLTKNPEESLFKQLSNTFQTIYEQFSNNFRIIFKQLSNNFQTIFKRFRKIFGDFFCCAENLLTFLGRSKLEKCNCNF